LAASQARQPLGNWSHFHHDQRPQAAFDARHPWTYAGGL